MANKAIFLDRDDTLIEDPGYINDPDQVKLLDGVPEALNAMHAMGFKLVVVSNQSAVARGIVTEEVLGQIHKRLEHLLSENKSFLDGIYYCPYHPDGVIAKYRRNSDHRKPEPGMLLDAAKDMDIDLKESWMVGNSSSDIEAGAKVGCRTILLDNRGHEQKIKPGQRAPDYRAVNLKEVVNIIKMHSRLAVAGTTTKPPQPIDEQKIETQPQEKTPQPEEPQQPSQQLAVEPPTTSPPVPSVAEEVEPPANKTEKLLTDILEELKNTRRSGLFAETEFSVLRFMAGVLQMAVAFCLLIAIWFLMGPDQKTDLIFIALGFAAVLQITALTLYTMHGPK